MIYIPIAPYLNIDFYVNTQFWEIIDGTPHRGVDLITHSSENAPLYSILDGTVLDKGFTNSAGNYLIIKGNDPQGTSTRMLHLKDPALVNIGDTVSKYQLIGYEGNTGQSQGKHLHLEMKYLFSGTVWVQSNVRTDYIDPCAYLGFPNVTGTAVRCNYSPSPILLTKKKFPWAVLFKDIRKKYIIKNVK